MITENESKSFELGILTITPHARETLDPDDVLLCLLRHGGCDWGDCTPEDAEENNFSVDKHLRLLSVYHDKNGQKFWIITEADRSQTTVLMPEDY
jgi:hypothetical protein